MERAQASSDGPDRRAVLRDAVAEHVRAGDTLHLYVGHTRWTAAASEVIRQWWGRDPGFTLVMLSLSSLGTLFFEGGLVRKVVTGYSGDTFPNFTPNPVFGGAYQRGDVQVEHWSFLAFSQRLEAAARGLPAIVTRSISGSSLSSIDEPEIDRVTIAGRPRAAASSRCEKARNDQCSTSTSPRWYAPPKTGLGVKLGNVSPE